MLRLNASSLSVANSVCIRAGRFLSRPCERMLRLEHSRPPIREADSLTCQRDCSPLVEKETDTGTYEVLPQIATLAGIELGARVIEIVVFDKRAHVRIKEVI